MKYRQKKQLPPTMLKVQPQTPTTRSIIVPKLEYRVVAQPIQKVAFTGDITAIPTVLLYYLHQCELSIIVAIMQETADAGACMLTVPELCRKIRVNVKKFYSHIHNLKKMGIILEYRLGHRLVREIDYMAVQHLNDLVEGEDRAVYKLLRRKFRYRDVGSLTKKELDKCFTSRVLPADHDPEEEEEYD